MLRPLVASVAAVLLLASCGDDDNGGAPAPPAARAVAGTLLGQPFTAADASALVLSRATCAFDGVNASATGLVLGFSSFSGLCSFVTQNQLCASRANAAIVTVLILRANLLGNAAPVQAGTYTISAATPSPDAQGNIVVAQAIGSRTDAVCATPAGTPEATSGTVRIDSVGATIAGSVDLVFPDGGRVAGPFSVPACGFQTDVCAAMQGLSCPGQRACLP
jgi:hypothetical protein